MKTVFLLLVLPLSFSTALSAKGATFMFYLFVKELCSNGSFKSPRCWHLCIISKQHGRMIVSSWYCCSAWNSCHSIGCCSLSLSLGIVTGRRLLLTEFLILFQSIGVQKRSPTGTCMGKTAQLTLQASSAAATTNFSRIVGSWRRKAFQKSCCFFYWSFLAVSWLVGATVPLLQVFSLSHQH